MCICGHTQIIKISHAPRDIREILKSFFSSMFLNVRYEILKTSMGELQRASGKVSCTQSRILMSPCLLPAGPVSNASKRYAWWNTWFLFTGHMGSGYSDSCCLNSLCFLTLYFNLLNSENLYYKRHWQTSARIETKAEGSPAEQQRLVKIYLGGKKLHQGL